MPRTDRPLQLVTKSEEGRPFGPAIFEISANSLTGRKGADPMLMLADVVASALAASAARGGAGAKGGRPPAGLEALLQILGNGDNGQTTMQQDHVGQEKCPDCSQAWARVDARISQHNVLRCRQQPILSDLCDGKGIRQRQQAR